MFHAHRVKQRVGGGSAGQLCSASGGRDTEPPFPCGPVAGCDGGVCTLCTHTGGLSTVISGELDPQPLQVLLCGLSMSWGSLWPGPPVSEDECAPLALRPPFPEGSIGNNCCALHQPDPLHPTPFPNRTRWSALLLPGPHTTAWSSRGPCSPPSCSPGSASVCRGFDGLLPPPEQVTRCGSREGTKSALALPLLEILLTPPVLGKCCILCAHTHTHTRTAPHPATPVPGHTCTAPLPADLPSCCGAHPRVTSPTTPTETCVPSCHPP